MGIEQFIPDVSALETMTLSDMSGSSPAFLLVIVGLALVAIAQLIIPGGDHESK